MQTPPLRSKIAKDRCTKSGLLADPRRQRTTRVDSAAPDACNGLCFGAGWQGDQLTHAVAQNTSGRGVLVNVRLEGRTFDRHVRPAVPRTPPAHLPRPRRTAPAPLERQLCAGGRKDQRFQVVAPLLVPSCKRWSVDPLVERMATVQRDRQGSIKRCCFEECVAP